MKNVDVYFVRGNTIISKLIRFFDKGKGFTHVAIRLDNSHVVDSQYPQGVRIRHFRFKNYETITVPLDIEIARKYIRYKYDFKKMLYFAFRVGKIWDTPNKFICSELVAVAMNKPEWVGLTPNDLYEKLTNE
jgi:hypothetical protein